MDWIEAFVQTTNEGIEIISGLLYNCGITGLIIEDENDFNDLLKNSNNDWDYIDKELIEAKKEKGIGITFFIPITDSGRKMFYKIKQEIMLIKEKEKEIDLGSLSIHIKNIAEEDWANNWKQYFKPISIGKKMIIKPSWEKLENFENKIILEIDPGNIFGTGTHETTQLCIESIEKYINENDKILDIGCGSGILSIASILLGASYADAIDIDENAINIAYQNANMNNISKEKYNVISGNILEDEKIFKIFSTNSYDIIEANIIADVIISLSNKIPKLIKNDGIFISSGIITDRIEDVKNALKQNKFEIIETKIKKDWAVIISKYKG